MITLAFYKGWGGDAVARIGDGVIRAVTLSRYSHVEAILESGVQLGGEYLAFSSSFRDGGVRAKYITFKPERWDLVEVAADPDRFRAEFELRAGRAYDFAGAMLSPLRLPWPLTGPRDFCSEVVAAGLGLVAPWGFSPARLSRSI